MNPQALLDNLPAPLFAAELADPEKKPQPPRPAPVAVIAREPLTPFLPREAGDDGTFPEELTAEPEPPLLVSVLRDPVRVAELLLDARGTQRVVLASIGAAVACTFFRATWMARYLHAGLAWPAMELGLAVLLGVAAALGPIYATSLLVSARMPLGRLGAAMLSAVGAGSLLLAGLAPPVWLAWRIDPQTLGPWAVLIAFAVVALATGAWIHRLLIAVAERTQVLSGGPARLTPEAAARVGIVARVAWMLLALTTALAFMGVAAP